MSNFKFFYPLNLEDLKKLNNDSQTYVVSQDYGLLEAIGYLDEIYKKFVGPEIILDSFDVLYSLLLHFNNLEQKKKNLFFTLMFKIMHLQVEYLETTLGDINNYAIKDIEERQKQCNILKMNVYIFCNLLDLFERKETSVVNITKETKKKNNDLEKDKEKSIKILSKLFSLSLNWLFNPQVLDEDFISCIINLSWKFFESSSSSKNREVINCITVIFGIGIEKYKQDFNFSNTVITLLQHKENLVNNIINLVETLVNDYNSKQVISVIIDEICNLDKKELNRNTVGAKNLSQFISDLTEKIPAQFVSSIPNLLILLEDDPYVIRNGVLNAIGSIVLKVLSEEKMDSDLKVIRNQLLDKLEEHIFDVTSFTRGKALQSWKRLCENSKIPISRINNLVELIVGRLSDKASYVRKQAIQFLTAFIEINQFTLKLPEDYLNEILEKETNKLNLIQNTCYNKKSDKNKFEEKEKEKENKKTQDEVEEDDIDKEIEENEDDDKMDVDYSKKDENKENVDETLIDQDFVPKIDALDSSLNKNELTLDPSNYEKQKCVVNYLENCIKISEQLKIAVPKIFGMLFSKNLTDVQEAIDFFVTEFEYDVHGSIDGVRKMLSLIFSSEKSIRDALKKAYLKIYMESPRYQNLTLRNKTISIVNRLTILIKDATVGEIVALEELLSQLMIENKFDSSLIQVLWQKFTMEIPNTTIEESRIAVHLISMLATNEPHIIRQNLDTLIDIGLKEREPIDFKLIENVCICLTKAIDERGKIDLTKQIFKLKSDHRLFSRLEEIIINNIQNFNEVDLIPLISVIVKVIYRLCELPNDIAEKILKKTLSLIVNNKQKNEYLDNSKESDDDYIQNYELLSRFIHLLGEIAINLMMFIEVDIATEIKKRNQLKVQNKESKALKKKTQLNKENADENLDEEMGLTGAVADEETEFLYHICNNDIVIPKSPNFLAQFSHIIVMIASNPVKYSNIRLQTAACLCLSKYMLVSERFCKDNLRLLFTILEKTAEPIIKINTIICCGDLCIRYPNLLDAWTPKIYLCLRSEILEVRKASFKVISRLILADMIKVKEQISEIAKVIVDEDIHLSNMAKTFFVELAKKNNNAIYNILPDVISNLSNVKHGVNEEKFEIVHKHLFELIDKDKQMLCLTEKLCQRFKIADNEQEWTGLSFCLTLIQINDKNVCKICENISCFTDKLINDRVNEYITLLINNIKKVSTLKIQTKEMIEEFEKKIIEIKNKGIEKNEEENKLETNDQNCDQDVSQIKSSQEIQEEQLME